MFRPLAGQHILINAGKVLVVSAVVNDALDPTFFLIQLVNEGDTDNWLTDPIEVFENDWQQWVFDKEAAILLP